MSAWVDKKRRQKEKKVSFFKFSYDVNLSTPREKKIYLSRSLLTFS